MKRTIGMLVAVGVLLAILPVSTMAYPTADEARVYPFRYVNANSLIYTTKAVSTATDSNVLNAISPYLDDSDKLDNGVKCKKIRVRGVWGFLGDNISDGHFGGIIKRTKRCDVSVFRGVYYCNDNGSNTSLVYNEKRGKFIVFMKHGYFNGKLITPKGYMRPITGLYKVDRENRLLKLRWLLPHNNGWAIAKMSIPEQSLDTDAGL